MRLGERVAEEEVNDLESYFVETNQWYEIFQGEKDLVFGSKGTGKSALYALINRRSDRLRERNVVVSLAENPIGATVFRNLEIDPPPSEIAFIQLWKMYILTLLADTFRREGIDNELAESLTSTLNKFGLLPKVATRENLFSAVRGFISKIFDKSVDSLETSLTLDPISGMPTLSGKIHLSENVDQRASALPVEDLIAVAQAALEMSDRSAWILFDRLDVAFSENPDLEKNALRALFRAYRDLRRFSNIGTKLFIRDDVWDRITEEGFAEASHLIRSTRITWDAGGLRNLVARRLAGNEGLLSYVGYSQDDLIESADAQKDVLDTILPDKVDIGKNPDTFYWMLSRVADGSKNPTPRELIHIFDEARRVQISRLERGEDAPEGSKLFERPVFKEALKEVSKVKYQQTFKAENPALSNYTDSLKGKKAEQTPESLAALWECGREEARERANELVEKGFFEKRGSGDDISFWIPFVYRDALELVQGKADI